MHKFNTVDSQNSDASKEGKDKRKAKAQGGVYSGATSLASNVNPMSVVASPKTTAGANEEEGVGMGMSSSGRGEGDHYAVELPTKRKTRRFSTAPLSPEKTAEMEANMTVEELDKRKMLLNSSGVEEPAASTTNDASTSTSTSTGTGTGTSTSTSTRTRVPPAASKGSSRGGSNDEPGGTGNTAFITIFKIKELQSVFSAGVEAPKMTLPLFRAAMSKILRSFRMLPLSEAEIYDVLLPFIDLQRKAHWMDAVTGGARLITFPTYHELGLRLNDVVRLRFSKRGRIYVKLGNFFCGVETSQTATDSKSVQNIGRLDAKHSMPPREQEIYAETYAAENSGGSDSLWYFRDHNGLYLTYTTPEPEADGTIGFSPAPTLRFSSHERGESEKFRLHFDEEEPRMGRLIISTATGYPHYIASCSSSSTYLDLLPRRSDNQGSDIVHEDKEAVFQFYLPYCDDALVRSDLEAICRMGN